MSHQAATEQKVNFILEIGLALHQYGAAAHHIETALTGLAHQANMDGHFFVSPTALMADLKEPNQDNHYRLRRVHPGGIDLAKLSQVDEIGDLVLSDQMSFETGLLKLNELEQQPSTYSFWLTLVAFACASGGFCALLNGSWLDIISAALLGVFTLLLLQLGDRVLHLKAGVIEPLIAFSVTLGAGLLAWSLTTINVNFIVLSALIVLIPGLSITVALRELSTKNLVSGTARLMGSSMELLILAFGVVFGLVILAKLPVSWEPGLAGINLSATGRWLVVGPAGVALAILFKSRPRDIFWITLGAFIAYKTAKYGSTILGPSLGVFFGGLSLAAYSNGFARLKRRPALTTLLPGLILLVPGSLGYRSLTALFTLEVLKSVNLAFEMVIIAVALVAGLSLGDQLVSSRRSV